MTSIMAPPIMGLLYERADARGQLIEGGMQDGSEKEGREGETKLTVRRRARTRSLASLRLPSTLAGVAESLEGVVPMVWMAADL
jgi:hypothetical protein